MQSVLVFASLSVASVFSVVKKSLESLSFESEIASNYSPCDANQRSASIAAMQPLPAAVTACR